MTNETTSDLFRRIRFRGNPLANPDSVVVSGHARFTMLTARLLRLEWSAPGEFEDRGTYAFPTRHAPAPPFTTHVDGDTLAIRTAALTLRYRQNSGRFTADNLSIAFDLADATQTWVPGLPNPQNLRGTRRTLDVCEGDAALEEGILSRAGWALFDDSRSVVFDPDSGWVAPRPDHETQDWYFFGYGHDYTAALAEYTRFGGPIPLIPRFVLGAWWSRYWAYSAQDLQDLVEDFGHHGLPLDVLVIDMDWHTPHSWTGYTWNRELFPDPPAFLRWAHEKDLRVTLNLHPAEGIQAFEEIYPRFARAMGVDPASGEPVPFRIGDRRFVESYFKLLHHPLEDEGVDFWWVDWQQGEVTEVKGLDALPWLNHLHFHDSARRGRRPMLYSRWGGLGNHRYHIGFSGDTITVWPALQFQPYFTATASNVCYGWWSHDIGGHMGGPTEPELYARWVQFGALSPCLRLHATKDPHAERRPWKYPAEVYRAARDAFHWRYQLVPYVYTMARVAADTGISLCRPMYYEYPAEDDAYVARYQYFFGDQMIAAPIVHPADPATGLATTDVWIPAGTWTDYATKETFIGPRWARLVGDLDRVPMLMRAGAILPLAPAPTGGTTGDLPRDHLILSVFPGAAGQFRYYEDDGVTETYREGQCEWTEVRNRLEDEDTWVVSIAPVEGRCDALPRQRGYEIRLEGSRRPQTVTLDGQPAEWAYDDQTLTTVVHVPLRDKGQPTTMVATAQGPISALGEAHNRRVVRADVARLLGRRVSQEQDLDTLLNVAPGAAPTDAVARLGGPFVRVVEYVTPEEAARQLGRVIVGGPARPDDPYDAEVRFSLTRAGVPEHHDIQISGATDSRVVDAPFAFDGTVQAMHWEADVRVTWRDHSLTATHRSQPLFPTILAWQALVYAPDAPVAPEQVLDEVGRIDETLDWQTHVQQAEGLGNLNRIHTFELDGAGYVATTIVSPGARDAVVLFPPAGGATLYLNGREVESVPVKEGEVDHPFLRFFIWHKMRRTETVRLRAGENTLVVHVPSPRKGRPWRFGGVVLTPGGDVMMNLDFKSHVRR